MDSKFSLTNRRALCSTAVLMLLLATACATSTKQPESANTQPAPVFEASAPATPAAASESAEQSPEETEVAAPAVSAAEPLTASAPSPEPRAIAPDETVAPGPAEADPAATVEDAAASEDDTPAAESGPELETETAPPSAPEPEAAAAPSAKSAEPEPTPQVQTMDLDGLETRLRQTKAIGLFTKLELKSQVGDLLEDVENYHRARSGMTLDQLQEHFNLLVMKLLVLLEQDDPQLHRDIARARPALWTTLADPNQFLSIRGP